MYVCRIKKRKYAKRNQRYAVRRYAVAVLLGAAALLAFFAGRKNLKGVFWKETVGTVYEGLSRVALPGAFYDDTADGSLLRAVCLQIFPLAEYTVQITDYETEIESALSYERILASEGLDENYVDENGQVVIQNTPSGENAGDGETAAQTDTDGSGADGSNAGDAAIAADSSAASGADGGTVAADGTAADSGNMDSATACAGGTAATVLAQQKSVEYSLDKLSDFDYLVQNFYQVDSTTTVKSDQLNVTDLLVKDMTISHNAGTPQILIYHTHAQEGYADSVEGDLNTTVVGVGEYLAQILREQYGFNVIHDTGVYDTVRDKAYSVAAPAVEQMLADHPEIDVIIDLHRDGVADGTRLVTNIGGTEMAKVMFFNGLSRTTALGDISYLYNPYIADNLSFSFQMQLAAAEYYPDFTRKIYLKGYRFNMHYRPKTLLVEVGAQTNTLQEAKNAMVPLADVLYKVLGE